MKNRVTKIIAYLLCTVLLTGTVGTAVYVLADSNKENKSKDNSTDTVIATDAADSNIYKDETVYVLAGADGDVQKIIVSDWIKNAIGADSLADESELSDIENIKGDESYTVDGENSYIWDAQGNDIYYQGNIEKELPLELAVTYKLDGNIVSPEELAGKSGNVTIRFDYTNQQYEYVEINGEEEKINVPFAVFTGVLLDNDKFTNVEVSNGKLVNDGDRTAIIGIAFPGLQEDLGIDPEKFEIPDYVEITADVTDFELGMTVTLATNELFNEIDTDTLDSIEDLKESLDELTNAMEQLIDGSSELYNGLCTLFNSSGELVEGIDELLSGSKTLKEGTGELDNGVSELQEGAEQLYEGLNKLASNNDSLNGGAEQVFDSLLSTADTQLAAAGLSVPALTMSNYSDVLNEVITSLDENAVYEQALATVTAAVEAQRSYIKEQVTAAVRDSVEEQVIYASTGIDKESYEAAVAAGAVDEQTQSAIVSAVEAQMKTDTIKNLIVENTETQVQKKISENMAGDDVQSQLNAASEGAQSVISLKASLDSYNSFYLGLKSYTSGVEDAVSGAEALRDGAVSLKDGSGKLYSGVSELYGGILTIKNGAPALVDGIAKLRDGAMQLSDGLEEFNEEGVQKLVEAVDGDLDSLNERIKATVDVSKNYKSFSSSGNAIDGQVKFIYRTEAVGTD